MNVRLSLCLACCYLNSQRLPKTEHVTFLSKSFNRIGPVTKYYAIP